MIERYFSDAVRNHPIRITSSRLRLTESEPLGARAQASVVEPSPPGGSDEHHQVHSLDYCLPAFSTV